MKRYLGDAVASSLCQAGAAKANPFVSGHDAGHRAIYDSGGPTMLLKPRSGELPDATVINRTGATDGDDPYFDPLLTVLTPC